MTSEISIRKASVDDLDKILQLNLKLFNNDAQFDATLNLDWPNTAQAREYFEARIKYHCALLAEDQDSPIGYLFGALAKVPDYRSLSALTELENMFVEEAYRSKGLGKRLVLKFLEWSKEQNAQKIRVAASALNEGTVSFYRSLGFIPHELSLEIDNS